MSDHALDAESLAKGLSASTYTDRSNTELLALYEIRVAIGDPAGKLEVAEVVERVRAMAEESRFFYGQLQAHSPKMSGECSYRFRSSWPMNHCKGISPRKAVAAAIEEMKRDSKEVESMRNEQPTP